MAHTFGFFCFGSFPSSGSPSALLNQFSSSLSLSKYPAPDHDAIRRFRLPQPAQCIKYLEAKLLIRSESSKITRQELERPRIGPDRSLTGTTQYSDHVAGEQDCPNNPQQF
jgi:hypothetical protein